MSQLRELLAHWPSDALDTITRALRSAAEVADPKCEADRLELRVVKQAATSIEKLAQLLK